MISKIEQYSRYHFTDPRSNTRPVSLSVLEFQRHVVGFAIVLEIDYQVL